MKKKFKGFASMCQTEEGKKRQKEIASKGGKNAHAKGKAHQFTSKEARAAGKKGGKSKRTKKLLKMHKETYQN